MVVLWFLKPDNTKIPSTSKDILGLGRTGVVLRYGEHALKIARVEDVTGLHDTERDMTEALNELNSDSLHNEIAIYKRLGSHEGILPVFQLSGQSIEMAYAKEGSLTQYIKNHREPTDALKARWIGSVAFTICYVHRCRITVDDIALRNFLIDDQLAIKLIDFGLSTLQHLDRMMEILATKADIFRVGFIIYSIATWKIYDYNKFEDGKEGSSSREGGPVQGSSEHETHWSRAESLPSVDHCICGNIIDKCWIGGYNNMDQVCDDVQRELGTLLY